VKFYKDEKLLDITLESLLKYLDCLVTSNSKCLPIGLDTEYPNHATGKKIPVIQLAYTQPEVCVIVYQKPTAKNSLPSSLIELIQHPKAQFVGRSIQMDLAYLVKDYNIKDIHSTVERLEVLCHQKGIVATKMESLHNLAVKTIGYGLEKDLNIRCSNWEGLLDTKKLQYAARDAWASLLIYLHASSLPDYPFFTSVEPLSQAPPSPLVEEFTGISSLPSPNSPHKERCWVLLDSFHAMKQITDRISRQHPWLWVFSCAFRDAMFIVNPSDQRNVETYLQNVENISFKEKLASNPDWIFERVRWYIPSPEILETNLRRIFEEFQKPIYNDRSGVPLLGTLIAYVLYVNLTLKVGKNTIKIFETFKVRNSAV
jgi:hypothetical protein